jgi:hypothetical protein
MWIQFGLFIIRISCTVEMLCIRADLRDLPVTLLIYLRTLFQSESQLGTAHRLPEISRYEEVKIGFVPPL